MAVAVVLFFLLIGRSSSDSRREMTAAAASPSPSIVFAASPSPYTSSTTFKTHPSLTPASPKSDMDGFTFVGSHGNAPSSSGYVELLEQRLPARPTPPGDGLPMASTASTPTMTSRTLGVSFEFRTRVSNALLLRRWFPRWRAEKGSGKWIHLHDDKFPVPPDEKTTASSEGGDVSQTQFGLFKLEPEVGPQLRTVGDGGRVRSSGGGVERELELWIGLKIGMLHVSLASTSPSGDTSISSISVGRDLDDDHWHRASVYIDDVIGRMNATVDGNDSKVIAIRHGDVTDSELYVAKAFLRPAVIFVGGTLPTSSRSLLQPLPTSAPETAPKTDAFIGCIRDVATTVDGLPVPIRLGDRATSVERGCRDACRKPANTCQHGGRCVNLYVSAYCDCYGTGHEGRWCENKDQLTITLHGTDWLTFQTSTDRDVNDRGHSAHRPLTVTRIALQFKTVSGDGLLFHSTQLVPLHCYLEVSLHNATLHVVLTSVNQAVYSELLVYLGNRLDDNRWHRVLVIQRENVIEVSLDGHVERMTLEHATWRFRMPSTVYFGGLKRSRQPFVGCLRELYLNDVNILLNLADLPHDTSSASPSSTIIARDKLSSQSPFVSTTAGRHGKTIYRESVWHTRSAQLNRCESRYVDVEDSSGTSSSTLVLALPLCFVWPGATSMVFGLGESESLILRMTFRTLKPNVAITWCELVERDNDAEDSKSSKAIGFFQLMLRDGRLAVSISPTTSSVSPGKPRRQLIVLGNDLHNGVWHSVRVSVQSGFAAVEVDQLRRVEFVSTDLLFGETAYIGFAPHINVSDGFVGCMRSVHIQNTEFSPVDLVRSSSSFGVTLGDSDVTDGVDDITWCHRPQPRGEPPCARKSNCSDRKLSDGTLEPASTELCDCSDLSRRKFCSFYALSSSSSTSSDLSQQPFAEGRYHTIAFGAKRRAEDEDGEDESRECDTHFDRRCRRKSTVLVILASSLSAVATVVGILFIAVRTRRRCRGTCATSAAVAGTSRSRRISDDIEYNNVDSNDCEALSPPHSATPSSMSSQLASACAASVDVRRHRGSRSSDDDAERLLADECPRGLWHQYQRTSSVDEDAFEGGDSRASAVDDLEVNADDDDDDDDDEDDECTVNGEGQFCRPLVSTTGGGGKLKVKVRQGRSFDIHDEVDNECTPMLNDETTAALLDSIS